MTIRRVVQRLSLALALMGCLLIAAGCAHMSDSAPARDRAQAEQELRALHEQWASARINGDVAFLERFYGQELRLQVMSGAIVERARDISFFDRAGKDRSQVIIPDFIHDDDLTVALYGDTAIVAGVETLRGTAFGNYGDMALRFTNVLVWRDGRWQLVHHQSTPMQR